MHCPTSITPRSQRELTVLIGAAIVILPGSVQWDWETPRAPLSLGTGYRFRGARGRVVPAAELGPPGARHAHRPVGSLPAYRLAAGPPLQSFHHHVGAGRRFHRSYRDAAVRLSG